LSKDQLPVGAHVIETVDIFRELILRQAQDDRIFITSVARYCFAITPEQPLAYYPGKL